MKKVDHKISGKKALSVLLGMLILISTLIVPLSLSAAAVTPLPITENETVTFSFEDAEGGDYSGNLADDGIGYTSWGLGRADAEGAGKVLEQRRTEISRTWPTGGGVRLNNKDGLYRLEANSKYLVTYRFRVLSPSLSHDDWKDEHESFIRLGYGFAKTENQSNPIDQMNTSLNVGRISVKTDQETYTATDDRGTRVLPVGETWQEAVCTFTTGSDLGSGSPDLGFFSVGWYGCWLQINDVSVTKLASDYSATVLIDEYYATATPKIGEIGTAIDLPTLTGKAEDHQFLGWFTDEARTIPAANAEFENGFTKLYSKWEAPVTITFVDSLNGTKTPTTGSAGQPIPYPADPTAPDGQKQWFIGWATTAAGTEMYDEENFGYQNLTLYAVWKGEVPGIVVDFDTYLLDHGATYYRQDNGNTRYNNEFVLGPHYTRNATGGEDGGVSMDYAYDKNMVVTPENPASYNAEKRFRDLDACMLLTTAFKDGETYRVSFRYKMDQAEVAPTVGFFTSSSNNIWPRAKRQGAVTLPVNNADGAWHTAELSFTVSIGEANHNGLFAVVTLPSNANVKISFDNFALKGVQPYESTLTIVPNNGQDNILLFGERGKAVNLPELTNGKAALLGLYTDKDCTALWEDSDRVFKRLPQTVYAKWSAVPISFDDYPYQTSDYLIFCSLATIKTGENVGCTTGDNAALNFVYRGSDVYEVDDNGKEIYWNTRTTQRDLSVKLTQGLKDKTMYRITYYYKTNSATNVSYTLFYGTGNANNVWDNGAYVAYDSSYTGISSAPSGWTKVTTCLTTNFPDKNGNALFLRLQINDGALDAVVDVDVDDVLVEEIPAPYVAFVANNGDDIIIQSGKVGDAISFPALENKGVTFLGWYTDSAFNNRFTGTTLTDEGITLYGKWSGISISFDRYNYHLAGYLQFGKTMRLINEPGAGRTTGDDYALGFRFVGSDVYSVSDTGVITYMNTRAGMRDHCAKLTQVKDKSLYKITYYYKNDPELTNTSYNIYFSTSHTKNIWGDYVKYGSTTHKVLPSESGWTRVETYVVIDAGKPGADWLYLQTEMNSREKEAVVSCRFDDIIIEEIEPPYVYFDAQNGSDTWGVHGNAGEAISYPATPVRYGYDFTGWYADRECTTPYTRTVFEANTTDTAYAGWKQAKTVTFDFEDYSFGTYEKTGKYHLINTECLTTSQACSGSHVVQYGGNGVFPIGNGMEVYETDGKSTYIISFRYMVVEKLGSSISVKPCLAHKNNFWDDTYFGTSICTIARKAEIGVWHTGVLSVDASNKVGDSSRGLYFSVTGGTGGMVYFDDVTVTRVEAGEGAVTFYNPAGLDDIPPYIVGPVGSNYVSRLPKKPTKEGYMFLGYYKEQPTGDQEKMESDDAFVIEAGSYQVEASAQRLITLQDFEQGDIQAVSKNVGDVMGIMDFDYEIYDSQAEGNSPENVTSGRYSLHRKGTTAFFENALILTAGDELSDAARYTVTMKVKLGKHFQTDGAVKIVSARAPNYAWITGGDYYPVVAIADLVDGQWHEVSYTYNSVERLAVIQTPGYCELFIDDVEFHLVDESTPLSNPISYTEYIPALRDSQGNLLKQEAAHLDVTSIIDASLYLKNGGSSLWIWFAIGGAVLVLAGAGVAVFFILKNKKKKTV